MTRTQSLAMLAALIAQQYGAKKVSAYTAAETSIKLHSLASSIVRNEVYYCNGFKHEGHDKLFAQYARDKNTQAANELQRRLNTDGPIAYEKAKTTHKKKLVRILAGAELPANCVTYRGLYGGLTFVAGGRDFCVGG